MRITLDECCGEKYLLVENYPEGEGSRIVRPGEEFDRLLPQATAKKQPPQSIDLSWAADRPSAAETKFHARHAAHEDIRAERADDAATGVRVNAFAAIGENAPIAPVPDPVPEFRNLTPHAINVRVSESETRTFPPSGEVARLAVEKSTATPEIVGGIEISPAPVMGAVVGLPDPQAGVVLIVSMAIATHPSVSGRADVVRPDTGQDAIRENGQIVAVRRFIRA